VGTLTPFALVAWFAAFGFLSAYVPVLVAHGKALFSPHQVGRGLTVLNMGTMGGTFLAQAISGFVIGLFPTGPDRAYELVAYRLVFGLQAGFILLTSLVYFGSRDPMEDRGTGTKPTFPA
jgi:MFS family permease